MQRFNAIFAFIENEFTFQDTYFDLQTLADTKVRLDRGELTRREPFIDRDIAVAISNYSIALSVFCAPDSASVDEVFRRINSGGRVADLVRVIASRIRGDTSPGDIVPLRSMSALSMSNRELPYGVQVDDIFWVREGVLRREDVRQSTDEQVVLDLIVDCVTDPVPTSGTRLRDEYYSYTDLGAPDKPTVQSRDLNLRLDTYGTTDCRTTFCASTTSFAQSSEPPTSGSLD